MASFHGPIDLSGVPPPRPFGLVRQTSVNSDYDPAPRPYEAFDVDRAQEDGATFYHTMAGVLDISASVAAFANNNDAPESTILLDETGSMVDMGPEPVQACNAYIRDQSANGVEGARVSFIKFSDRIHVVYRSKLATDPTAAIEEYRPDGMTALFDALRFTILTANKPQFVLIITDGKDNISVTRNTEINGLIERAKGCGWDFRFVGCNAIAREQGAVLPMPEVSMQGVPEGEEPPPLPTILLRASTVTTETWRSSSVPEAERSDDTYRSSSVTG